MFASFFTAKDFSKLWPFTQTPGFDMKTALETQRKNMHVMTEAQSLAIESMRNVIEKQADMMRQIMRDNAEMAKSLIDDNGPEGTASQQAKIFKTAYERNFKNMREMSELLGKAGAEASDLVSRRLKASMNEMRAAHQTSGKKTAA